MEKKDLKNCMLKKQKGHAEPQFPACNAKAAATAYTCTRLVFGEGGGVSFSLDFRGNFAFLSYRINTAGWRISGKRNSIQDQLGVGREAGLQGKYS